MYALTRYNQSIYRIDTVVYVAVIVCSTVYIITVLKLLCVLVYCKDNRSTASGFLRKGYISSLTGWPTIVPSGPCYLRAYRYSYCIPDARSCAYSASGAIWPVVVSLRYGHAVWPCDGFLAL